MAVKPWMKLLLDIIWALVALSVLQAVYRPQESYWTILSRVMQVCSLVHGSQFWLTYLKISSKALVAAAVIVFVEKLFLNFVAIKFHQKALADRLEENRLGLKALDSLSNAHPVASKKPPHPKRGHKRVDSTGPIDLATLPHPRPQNDNINISTDRGYQTTSVNDSKSKSTPRPKRGRKKVTSVIVDQVSYPTLISSFVLLGFYWVFNQGGRSNWSICTEKFQVS